MSRGLWRFRLAVCCLLLSAFTFLQSPGQIAADTKLDLTADPGAFLGRALHLWNPQGFFGELQNQAYGYLFPQGSFFLLGHAIALPAWVIQRLWWSLILIVAFLGIVRLSRLLGLSNPVARVVAGLAYAVSPRVMSTIGPISSETWEMALAPWILVPLVAGSLRGTERRWAGLSGIALACAGGINAVATVATLPAGVWFLLTRSPGPRRARLAAWWAVAIVLASTWWLLPLVLLGKYSPAFLDWIESGATTTLATDSGSVLRGTDDWVPYIAGPGGPSWPAGWTLITQQSLLVATGLLALAGVAGLCARRTQERLFLVGLLTMGLILITFGHVSGVWTGAPWAPTGQTMLDHALAPLRNLHKFDPLVRLPLAIGVGWSWAAIAAAWARKRPVGPMDVWAARRVAVPAVAGVAVVVALLGAAWPLLSGGITSGRTYVALPDYWDQTANWLATSGGPGTALIVPGASFGDYLWGTSQDEPLQALASSNWAVRDAVPLSSAGNIRALDAIEQLFADGRGSAGLAAYLSRMGVTHLVVRNDLNQVAASNPRSSLVHQVLNESGGFDRVAYFGPLLAPYRTSTIMSDDGLQEAYPAVEIYAVNGGLVDPRVVLRDASDPLRATGGTESLLPLAQQGLLGQGTVLVGGDTAAGLPSGTVVQTDSYRRVEIDVGQVHDNASATLTGDQAWQLSRKGHDYEAVPPEGNQTVAVWADGASATASTSASDAGSWGGPDAGSSPFAAIDGDPDTAWRSAPLTAPEDQWWQANFDVARQLDGLTVHLGAGLGVVTPRKLRVLTAMGSAEAPVSADGRAVFPTVKGPTTWVRIEPEDFATDADGQPPQLGQFAIAQVSGLGPMSRPLLLPGGPAAIVSMSARGGSRSSCVSLRTAYACSDTLTRTGEEDAGLDRIVNLLPGTYWSQLQVRAQPGAALDQWLMPLSGATATATSSRTNNPLERPQAAIDQDIRTTWAASPLDRQPTLTVNLRAAHALSWLQFLVGVDAPVNRPLGVVVTVGGKSFSRTVDGTGRVDFPVTSTSTIAVTFISSTPMESLNSTTGGTHTLPVGVSELVLGQADVERKALPLNASTTFPCGDGPVVSIGGVSSQTTVHTSVGALLTGKTVTATSCAPPTSDSGSTRFTALSNSLFSVVGATITSSTATSPSAQPPTTPAIVSFDSNHRVVEVQAEGYVRTVELAENANIGWTASIDGSLLQSVRVDGWRQAWVLPPGVGGTVVVDFTPDHTYRAALVIGAFALLLLVILTTWRPKTAASVRPVARAVKVPSPFLRMAALLAALAVAGPVGLAAALVGVLPWSNRRMIAVALTVGGAALALTGAVMVPWPTSSGSAGDWIAWTSSAGIGLLLGGFAMLMTTDHRVDREITAERDAP